MSEAKDTSYQRNIIKNKLADGRFTKDQAVTFLVMKMKFGKTMATNLVNTMMEEIELTRQGKTKPVDFEMHAMGRR